MNPTATATALELARPPKPQLRVLLVEDDPADRDLILGELAKGEFEIIADVAATAAEFRQRIATNRPDVVLADYNLGQWRGTEALEILRQEGLDIPLILVSGALGDVTAVECIKQGVTDYVLKDSLARLSVALRGALKDKNVRAERKRAQVSLAEKVEELARSNADLEQFAYVASHDLQEPLRMVSAYTQLLAERYRGKLDDQADKYIHYAIDGATRMQSLIQDLLAFSRVGRQEYAFAIRDCNQLVDSAVENLRAAILETGAAVTHGPLPQLMANGSQLQQVFQNLIGNAIKFHGPKSPIIEISASQARRRMALFRGRQRHWHLGGACRKRLYHLQPPAHPHRICRQWHRAGDLQEDRRDGTEAGFWPNPTKAEARFSTSPCRRPWIPKDRTRHDHTHPRFCWWMTIPLIWT